MLLNLNPTSHSFFSDKLRAPMAMAMPMVDCNVVENVTKEALTVCIP